LAVSLDIRETMRIEVSEAGSGELIGQIDFTQAPVFQLGEVVLSRDQVERILKTGVALRIAADNGLARFFSPGGRAPSLLQPHLMVAEKPDRWRQFFDRMTGLETIQTFSWMEGCLLDGIYDLDREFGLPGFRDALVNRLSLYLQGPDLIYESPQSKPVDNQIYGIEGTLPFAVIARVEPEHPSIQLAIDFWRSHERPVGEFAAGSVQDGPQTSAEGSLCVAYPMLVIARARGERDLENLALAQYRIRRELLVTEDGSVCLRNSDGEYSFRNWARGIAWYFLGLVRGLAEVSDREDVADLRVEAERLLGLVLAHQGPDGLWANIIDDPTSAVDTSGSAGIAAALALGHRAGLLSAEARDAAVLTRDGLTAHLLPDGWLGHGTPSNRAGQGLSSRRVIFPVGMGLTAQLLAALGDHTWMSRVLYQAREASSLPSEASAEASR
jgi:hypothetical protein